MPVVVAAVVAAIVIVAVVSLAGTTNKSINRNSNRKDSKIVNQHDRSTMMILHSLMMHPIPLVVAVDRPIIAFLSQVISVTMQG